MPKPKNALPPPDITPEANVTRETLNATADKIPKFLRTLGTNVVIRALVAQKGYTEEVHRQGWAHLHAASGYAQAEIAPTIDKGVRDAIVELDNLDEDLFRVVRATLVANYPAVAAVVLEGIGPSTGPEAVVGVKALLGRLATLGKSKNKDDKAALALLATRSVDDAERSRLGALVAKAESTPHVVPVDEKAKAAVEAKHLAALIALRAWYEEWSEIARAAVKRRDHLILLGLAKRKSPKAKKGGPAAPVTPKDT